MLKDLIEKLRDLFPFFEEEVRLGDIMERKIYYPPDNTISYPPDKPIFSGLSNERAFFRSEGSAYVLDNATKKVFFVSADSLREIEAIDIKLKIVLESPVISETEALRLSRAPDFYSRSNKPTTK
jgi:hypothetical protein